MKCKYCDAKTIVKNSRNMKAGTYRRRECLNCKRRFTTMETKPSKALDDKFNEGFMLSLILLVRSYPPLSEHAFNIFQEAGYEYGDFVNYKIDPSDRDALNTIFSL